MGRRGVSKVQLAADSRLHRTMVSDIVRGLQQADIEQLEALCVALGLNMTREVIEVAQRATEGRQFTE
jgi:ribosome-binding protein aMBF1 (putative translation factor)